MTLIDVLAELDRRQVSITAHGDRLRASAPQGALTNEIRELLAAHKPELLAYLAGRRTVTIRPDDDPIWRDPRPDLLGDSASWSLLLAQALEIDGDLFGMLAVLRGMGARLAIAGPTGWTLRPEGPLPAWTIQRGDDMTAAEYADFRRRHMLAHQTTLARLLAGPTDRQAPAQVLGPETARIPLADYDDWLADRQMCVVGSRIDDAGEPVLLLAAAPKEAAA